MRQIFHDILGVTISSIKVICGSMLLTLYQTELKLLFLFSSLFLLMNGIHYLVYFTFDKIEMYVTYRRVYKIKNDALEVKNE